MGWWNNNLYSNIISIAHSTKFKFIIWGGLSTFLGFYLFPSFYKLFDYQFFNSIFFATTLFNILFSFLGHKYFVFKSTKPIIKEFNIYICGLIIFIIFSYAVNFILIKIFNVNVYISNFFATLFNAILSYFYQAKITFNEQYK